MRPQSGSPLCVGRAGGGGGGGIWGSGLKGYGYDLGCRARVGLSAKGGPEGRAPPECSPSITLNPKP